jgi:hypothetical protein
MSLVTSRWTAVTVATGRGASRNFCLSIYYWGIQAFAEIIIPVAKDQSGKGKSHLDN